MARPKRKRASFSETQGKRASETETPVVTFDVSMTDEAIDCLLKNLVQQGDATALETENAKIACAMIEERKLAARKRFFCWNQRFTEAGAKMLATIAATQQPSFFLGSKIRSMGYGSSASKHIADIDKTLQSCKEGDADQKGMMLAHPFYRRFLRHLYNDDSTNGATESKNKAFFSKQYADIWKQTEYGLVGTTNKNTNLTTSEPAATSLLSGTINQLVPVVLGDGRLEAWFPRWMSEFALRTSKTGESDKEPRSDGILGAPDPANGDALRALVSMEAKLSPFSDGDRAQSRSNACDAFSRQPEDTRPWPLLVLRFILGEHQAAVEAHAMVPISKESAKLVSLWKGSDNNAGAMYKCVAAALRASKDFIELVKEKKRAPLFCNVMNNVAFQDVDHEDVAVVYKSFFDTKRRHINLELVQEFVDPEAKEYRLGEKGSFIEMRDVGPVLFNEVRSCSVHRFVEVGNDLERLHKKGKTHGDIRLSNLILGGEQGKIVDWDLAGNTDEKKYPAGLKLITDGARPGEVEKAIVSKGIGDLPLRNDHDWESLRAVMRCFAPADKARHQPSWESLIADISEGTERTAAREDFEVQLVSEVGPLKVATGTPPSPL